MGTFRPKDVGDVYSAPRPEIARLTRAGVVHRVASGYYIVVPQSHVGRHWLPELEPAGAGIASATFGRESSIVMGVSAARVHGATPRALSTAIVAVPKQHRPIVLSDRNARVIFVKRNTDSLDAEMVSMSIGSMLVTTPEQTLIDLAKRPSLGGAEVDVPSAVAFLYARCDMDHLEGLARIQRATAALSRARDWVVEAA